MLQITPLVCKTMAFGVSEIIQNLTLHPRDKERQSKIIARDKPCLLQFNTFFWEVVLLFFFLSFGMRNFVPRLSPKNILQKFTY